MQNGCFDELVIEKDLGTILSLLKTLAYFNPLSTLCDYLPRLLDRRSQETQD
jgi:hypothetical protein